MEFGVPSKKRVAKAEKYPNTAVITLLPYEGENTSRKIEFNKKASEMMGFKADDINMVAFSFNRSDFTKNAVVNTNNINSDASLKVAKNGKVSNKSHYEEIKTRYGVSMEEELELTIIDSGNEFSGQPVFNLITLASALAAMDVELKAADEAAGEDEEGSDDASDLMEETATEQASESTPASTGPATQFGAPATTAAPAPSYIDEQFNQDDEDDNDLPF